MGLGEALGVGVEKMGQLRMASKFLGSKTDGGDLS